MDLSIFERLKKIRGLVFNFDGVFTNNRLLLLNNGELLREVNRADAKALAYAVQKRYRVAIILNDHSEGIHQWLKNIGVRDIFLQNEHTQASYETFAIENGLSLSETLFMSNDVDDLTSIHIAGVSACPADAVTEVKSTCNYICEAKGGEGCVREAVRLIMKAHNQWEWS